MRLIDADVLERVIEIDMSGQSYDAYLIAKQAVAAAPTIDAVPVVHGEWSQRSCFDEDENVYVCSVCDEPWTLTAGTPLENNMHHCPNCGAKMKKCDKQ